MVKFNNLHAVFNSGYDSSNQKVQMVPHSMRLIDTLIMFPITLWLAHKVQILFWYDLNTGMIWNKLLVYAISFSQI